jgi:hypothetical protein
MSNEKPDPATDDARSSDGRDAELRRDRLADEASKGLHRALRNESATIMPSSEEPAKTPASSSLGTVAEGMVEDGEAASEIEMSKSSRKK